MKNANLITMSDLNTNLPEFQDKHLLRATKQIISIYQDAAAYATTKNHEIAKILGEVAEKKSYEKDGFTSVADYAYQTFGIARQNAYALANAGKVYNDDSKHAELHAMTPSKLAELANVDEKTLTEALNTGKIDHNTTQKELRDFATSVKKSTEEEKPVIVDEYTARPCVTIISDSHKDTFSVPKTIEEWDEFFHNYVVERSPNTMVEIINLPKGSIDSNSKKKSINRRLYFNRNFSIVVEFFKYTPPKSPKKVTSKFTRDELTKMLADLDNKTEN